MRWLRLPEAGAWRFQKVDGNALAISRKLEVMLFDLAFFSSKPEDILSFLRDITGLRIEMNATFPEVEASIQVVDLPAGQCLELLLLPLGLDFRIGNGGIEVFERKELR